MYFEIKKVNGNRHISIAGEPWRELDVKALNLMMDYSEALEKEKKEKLGLLSVIKSFFKNVL